MNPELQIKSKFTKQRFLPHIPKWSIVMCFQAQLPCAAVVISGAKLCSLPSAPQFVHCCLPGAEVQICLGAEIFIPFVEIKQIVSG